MTDITRYYGTLDNCSTYRFENYMSRIKRMVRGTGDPLIQVANTLFEHNAAGAPASQTHVPRSFKKRDCVRLCNGKFAVIHEIAESKILCEVFNQSGPFYSKPCDSRIVGIYEINMRFSDMVQMDVTDIDCPAIGIPLSILERNSAASMVFLPLMHAI